MKRFALVTAVAFLFVGARLTFGQGSGSGQARGGNPFVDHSDTGETVHILPAEASIHSPRDTQPTFAPVRDKTAVYTANYGSGNLIDHGGLQIPNAAFYAIYWNSSVANSNKTSLGYTTIQAQMTAFINNFPSNTDYSGSSADDYGIIQQYGSRVPIANTLANWGVLVDQQPTQANISDSNLRKYLAGLFNTGKALPSSSTIYGVYLPAGMKVTLQGGGSCSSFCGYHGSFNYGGTEIKYAAFPYLDCKACSLSGLSVADMMTIVTSHEIREAVTDPSLNAWYDSAGYEADDKCAWHNLYQMTSGGFWVQPEYSNGGTKMGVSYAGPGCVVPNR
jgi:hypothetical protein